MITSDTKIDLRLHECEKNSQLVQRITDYLLSTPVELFHSTEDLLALPFFISGEQAHGAVIFHEQAVCLADMEGKCNNPAFRDANLPNLKQDYSYAFIPQFVHPKSPFVMPSGYFFDVLQLLKQNGFHIAQQYGHTLFGKRP